ICLLPPVPKGPGYEDLPAELLPFVSLPKLPDVLAVADVCIMPDTGPAHIAAAARTWGTEKGVIWLAGSSNPLALAYPGNQWVMSPPSSCQILPCGWHGYTSPTETIFVNSEEIAVKKDEKRAACIYDSYLHDKFAPCMARIDTEAVVEKVMMALN
ncbi:MAG: glycosyltransferase family 9 protein, partial [Candidatus Andersenbacteria bacterium]